MSPSSTSESTSEPSVIADLSLAQKQRLTDLLDTYFSNLERGLPTNVERMLADNTDIASALSTYLDQLNALHQVAAGFAGPGVDGNESPSEPTPAPDRCHSNQYADEQRLGDFVLKDEIGRGGMGVVYEARQISLDRIVALKLLPFAAVLDQSQIARFRNEAQAAAQICHPNIVPVYAIGAERGVNYYAMQLINGQPLDQAIRELRGATLDEKCPSTVRWADMDSSAQLPLPTDTLPSDILTSDTLASDNRASPDKLAAETPTTDKSLANVLTSCGTPSSYYRTVAQLGIQAADALHAAHEYGVVHRDIKPSNLLLDQAGKLWITDFGLARCQSDVSLTQTGDLLGTMRYMSREQALGQNAFVDHRTDIYSLGITLYELLTLRPAFNGDSSPEMLRQIKHDEPTRPRSISPNIPSDLETVVLKAMSKERDARYTTAAELSADLKRFLNGEPTIAKPPSILKRIHKWSRRNRRSVAVATGVLASLFVVTFIVRHHAAESEQNWKYSVEAGDLGIRLYKTIAAVSGHRMEKLRGDLVRDSIQYCERIASQTGDDPALLEKIAYHHNLLGFFYHEINDTENSIAAYEKTLQEYQQLIHAEPQKPIHRRFLALAHNNLGRVFAQEQDILAATTSYERALDIQTDLLKTYPTNHPQHGQLQADYALSQNNFGELLAQIGDFKRAAQFFQAAIDAQQYGAQHLEDKNGIQARTLAAFYKNLGSVSQDKTQAAIWIRESLDTYEQLTAAQPHVREYRHLFALAQNEYGKILSHQGNLADAVVAHDKAIEVLVPLQAADPSNQILLADLALCYHGKALAEGKQQHIDSSIPLFKNAIRAQESLAKRHPQNNYYSVLGGMYNNLGNVLQSAQRIDQAAKAFERAVHFQQVAVDGAPKWQRFARLLNNHLYNYGRVLRLQGEIEQAAATAIRRKDLRPYDADHLVSVAQEFVSLLDSSQRKLSTHGNEALNDAESAYGHQAVATLRQAQENGWRADQKSLASFEQLKTFPSFQTFIQN